MDFKTILSDLKKKVYHPIYFLSGEEPYFIDAIADYIEKNVLSDDEKEFNQQIVYGKDTDINSIISSAKRYPMMANHNVVIVKEAQHLEKQLEQLDKYLEQPTKSTILVFCFKYKKLDGRKSFTKKIAKSSVYFESPVIYENQLPQWIEQYLKEKKYSIEPKATLLIAQSLGAELSKISNELDKLTINIQVGNTITAADVEKNIGINKDYSFFELNKALGEKNILKANEIITYFSKNEKAHPLQVLIALLYSFFTSILKYHYTKDKSQNNLAAVLRINRFFVKDYEVAARNYSIKKAVKIIEYLREYDLKSKGIGNNSTNSGELMKELIFKILH